MGYTDAVREEKANKKATPPSVAVVTVPEDLDTFAVVKTKDFLAKGSDETVQMALTLAFGVNSPSNPFGANKVMGYEGTKTTKSKSFGGFIQKVECAVGMYGRSERFSIGGSMISVTVISENSFGELSFTPHKSITSALYTVLKDTGKNKVVKMRGEVVATLLDKNSKKKIYFLNGMYAKKWVALVLSSSEEHLSLK